MKAAAGALSVGAGHVERRPDILTALAPASSENAIRAERRVQSPGSAAILRAQSCGEVPLFATGLPSRHDPGRRRAQLAIADDSERGVLGRRHAGDASTHAPRAAQAEPLRLSGRQAGRVVDRRGAALELRAHVGGCNRSPKATYRAFLLAVVGIIPPWPATSSTITRRLSAGRRHAPRLRAPPTETTPDGPTRLKRDRAAARARCSRSCAGHDAAPSWIAARCSSTRSTSWPSRRVAAPRGLRRRAPIAHFSQLFDAARFRGPRPGRATTASLPAALLRRLERGRAAAACHRSRFDRGLPLHVGRDDAGEPTFNALLSGSSANASSA